ncbi:U7 snRNA-associated Sm-like LSm11, partial [Charadrius vociferus]
VHEGSPLGELHRCVRDGVKINVHIRTFKGLRGVCTGFLVAFDKFWNMALTDVDETYRKPVMGKAFYTEPQLTLTRLFDRLKLQESSVKRGADSKTVSEELALTNDSQTLGLKVGSGRARADDDRERQKRLGRGEKKMPSDSLHLAARGEADVGSGTAHTEGASAGATRARSQSRRKRRPKVDYQQVFTRHINQIFIRGENVLLVHLAH